MAGRPKKPSESIKAVSKAKKADRLSQIKAQLEYTHGIMPMPCGCYIFIQKAAFEHLSTHTILRRMCQAAAECGHEQTLN